MGIVLAILALLAVAAAAVKRSRYARGGSVLDQLAAAVMERAQNRFVLDYSQLVAARSMAEYMESIATMELPRSALTLTRPLGEGNFGRVIAANITRDIKAPASRWRHSGSTGTGNTEVAVKVRRVVAEVDDAALAAEEALAVEALLLRALEHPSIVRVVGLVSLSAPIMVVMELMPNGDLRDFLRKCRPDSTVAAASPAETLNGVDMVAIAARLASAMAFLERNAIIHRDLACRNILVGASPREVKIADLGAARNLFKSAQGTYVATTEHTPARWMSLEALAEGTFSHKSDVFAFGVLVWELLSYGRTPWGAFGVVEMIEALRSGDRMPPPAMIAEEVEVKLYAIAGRCWAEAPKKRPPFRQLFEELQVFNQVLKVVGLGGLASASPSAGSLATSAGYEYESEAGDYATFLGPAARGKPDAAVSSPWPVAIATEKQSIGAQTLQAWSSNTPAAAQQIDLDGIGHVTLPGGKGKVVDCTSGSPTPHHDGSGDAPCGLGAVRDHDGGTQLPCVLKHDTLLSETVVDAVALPPSAPLAEPASARAEGGARL